MTRHFGKLISIISSLAIVAAIPAFALNDQEHWTHSGDNIFENGQVDLNGNLTISQKDGSARLTKGGAMTVGSLTSTGVLTGVASESGAAVTSTNATAVDTDYGNMRKTVITLASTPLVFTVGHVALTNWHASAKIYDFPTGRIFVAGVVVKDLTCPTNPSCVATSAVAYSLGSVAGTGPGMTSTEVDLCATNSMTQLTNYYDSCLASDAQFDGTTTALDMYLNANVASNNIALAATNTVSGTVTIHWINLGKY